MKNPFDQTYILKILQELLNTPSPTGYCHHIIEKVRHETEKLGYAFHTTNKGGGVITVPGQSSEVLGISAHVDTLGAMVRSIKPSGSLKLTSVGGYMGNSIENEYCQVHTRDGRTIDGTILTTKPSVHVYSDARDMKRDESVMEVRLDEIVSSKADVEALGIRVGDFVSFDPRVQIKSSGYVKSRHLDDKASVAAIFGMLEWMKREGVTPQRTLNIFITTYEEVGHGLAHLPAEVTELLAVDMGAMGDDLTGNEQQVSICAKDSSGPYDYAMTTRLIELAERDGIAYAIDIYPNYGSDASAALRGGNDIRAALIGPVVHASHAMERTHIHAILGTAALIAAYATDAAVNN
ncbi:M42 family metallopeptidase [Paenibacillus sp. N1-5-1-14]|uniref:M42 family metallopeptidase n=1 Tax=Paenibacillus radicibacter TaxID=2972488 RepID=UPI002159046F|nr:M42 family metallopeptidase [Paenibacillus radicibacter]MCR8641356.1 M42 family metallopeptidase [Paenibacillus radicibacter]